MSGSKPALPSRVRPIRYALERIQGLLANALMRLDDDHHDDVPETLRMAHSEVSTLLHELALERRRRG